MAEIVSVQLVDDLDQSPADEKILFSLGGSYYEIDLSKKNADAFHKAMKPYMDAARPAGRGDGGRGPGRPKGSTGKRGTRVGEDYPREAVRTWAKSKGMDVGDRGRIKAEIVEKWKAAGSPAAPEGS